jgi:hypothetical protein
MKKAFNVISNWVFELKTNPESYLCKKWMKQIQSAYYDKEKNPWESPEEKQN